MMCNINYRIFGVVVGKTLLRPSLQIHNNKEQIKNPKRIIKRTIFSTIVFYLLNVVGRNRTREWLVVTDISNDITITATVLAKY
jgi:hypothetical protein